MFDFFKKKAKKPSISDLITDSQGSKMLILRHDNLATGNSEAEFLELAAEKSNYPVFRGQIQHLYESDFTGFKDKCPRCQKEVVRMFSNFAYATQQKSRLLTAPAGLFCQSCLTVMIDDDMMRASIDRSRFQYFGFFSVEDGYSGVNFIQTINGVKPTFILDETQEEIGGFVQSVHQPKDGVYYDPKSSKFLGGGGINYLPSQSINTLRKQKAKKKSKNKDTKQSKKANRKK